MAYTDLPNVSVGDLYTADNFNTHLRDNFRAGVPDAFTAKGDIAFGEGADTIGILALGNAGECLTCDAAETIGVKWAPAGFFDWFTFGAFSCASLDDVQLSGVGSKTTIADVTGDFGIPDTSANLFLTSLSTRRSVANDTTAATDNVSLYNRYSAGENEHYLMCLLLGDSADTGWAWNTQTGLMMSDQDHQVGIIWTHEIPINVRIKIWGYA